MIRRLFRIFGFETEYSVEYSDNSKVFFKKKRDDYSEYSVSTPSIPIIQFFFDYSEYSVSCDLSAAPAPG